MAASDAFPEDLAREILVRCPVKSLLRFKCACKKWYALIKTPDFVQEHLNCSKNKPPQLLIYNYDAPDDDSPVITLISDNGVSRPSHEENPQRFRVLTNLLGSVDGLFFLATEIDNVVSCALWNPATREVRHLPAPKIEFQPFENSHRYFGFGIDPLTNDYKALYFLYESDEYAAVYSCSRDSWRIFKPKGFNESLFRKLVFRTYGPAYLNGAYYWLLSGTGNCSILLFDFGSEVFEEIVGPDDHYVDNFALGLILLDDSIAILNVNVDKIFAYEIWVMIQPGVWNKLFTFQCFTWIKSCYDSSLILVTKASRLVSYNVRTNKTRHLGFHHSSLRRDPEFGGCGVFRDPESIGGCGVYYYKESLVTIKQRENGELDH